MDDNNLKVLHTADNIKRKRIRRNFGKIKEDFLLPDLISVQKNSYEKVLQSKVKAEDREDKGLQSIFNEYFPVHDEKGHMDLTFLKYEFKDSKYDTNECVERGITYAAALKGHFSLTLWEVTETSSGGTVKHLKHKTEQKDVYLGEIPIMTSTGTFIVNGVERVVVSQVHRSHGILFEHDKGKNTSGRPVHSVRLIPYRGTWGEIEIDSKDIVNLRLDRKRKKVPITTLLMALDSQESEVKRKQLEKKGKSLGYEECDGMSKEEILQSFYGVIEYTKTKNGWKYPFNIENLIGRRLINDLIDAETGEVVLKEGEKVTRNLTKQRSWPKELLVSEDTLYGKFLASDQIDTKTGALYSLTEKNTRFAEAGNEIDEDLLNLLVEKGITKIGTLEIDRIHHGDYIRNTLFSSEKGPRNREESLRDIFRVLRPGEPPTANGVEKAFRSLFFDPAYYDLSAVGRVKTNYRLGYSKEEAPSKDERALSKKDIIAIVRKLSDLRDGRGEIDDVDHLGNRRVRTVGELMENHLQRGIDRLAKNIKEKMQSATASDITPNDLINPKHIISPVRDFFSTSQLSQFMDQTNPLSEITNKRRLSALGPGGLTRERAGFEVRDVHPTHYGRICPIETPEGQNIGLINSLSCYAKINEYGFIVTPYRVVKDSVVTEETRYLSAIEETDCVIAQANSETDINGRFLGSHISGRKGGNYDIFSPEEIDYMDISPKQLISVAAALIPFLENDDANRALMGSNMQRQAVPLIKCSAPLVGTGMEAKVALDSGVLVTVRRKGVVELVDARRIVVSVLGENEEIVDVDIYNLRKFQKTNHNTCINQRPLVKPGDRVSEGEVIADGQSTEMGELALGQNVLVGFMSWNGFNFEDSILVSERLLHEDIFTSIHIEEYEISASDTKLGEEQITRDIPNVLEEALIHLDETGIVQIGAEVSSGSILVGKITPKGESPLTPEEKLLKVIFGDKINDVKDTSLRLPPGVRGVVVDVKVLNRRGVDKDDRTLAIETLKLNELEKDKEDEKHILDMSYRSRFSAIALGKEASSMPVILRKTKLIDKSFIEDTSIRNLQQIALRDVDATVRLEELNNKYTHSMEELDGRIKEKISKVQSGSDLPAGILKIVKVFVAVKRKLQPGDKMAGRHGNKGVVSAIVPVEDMPYLASGRSVDIILNPLGLPSRMNLGQILETHLGMSCLSKGEEIYGLYEKAEQDVLGEIRKHLLSTYAEEDHELIESLSGVELKEMAKYLRKGVPVATPVFDAPSDEKINSLLEENGHNSSGKVVLYDGRTGERFDNEITVGVIYIMKLHHLVDEKMHARSTGPYSLITQQPLGGKGHFGGQRFGEMEVWALQAYGAAYTLQEMLTIKSDDVIGRARAYDAIVRGDTNFELGVPESFNVLFRELRGLGLNIDLR